MALTEVTHEGHVALLRLTRPDKHNAFNQEMSQAVTEAFDALEADDDVRCVVITGTGAAFSAGADFNEAVAAIDERGRSDGMGAAVVRIARFRKPLVACVNGFAYGGGAVLAVTCDIRIASEEAAFRFPGAAYGLVVGASQLPRIVGDAYAKELLFSGRVVKADEALRMGLVNRVVPHKRAEAATLELAQQIAANSAAALVATKDVVNRSGISADAVAAEANWNRELRQSPDHHERFRAAADRVVNR
jgi:enoyl-CoA hydratase/carnithine racemase